MILSFLKYVFSLFFLLVICSCALQKVPDYHFSVSSYEENNRLFIDFTDDERNFRRDLMLGKISKYCLWTPCPPRNNDNLVVYYSGYQLVQTNYYDVFDKYSLDQKGRFKIPSKAPTYINEYYSEIETIHSITYYDSILGYRFYEIQSSQINESEYNVEFLRND